MVGPPKAPQRESQGRMGGWAGGGRMAKLRSGPQKSRVAQIAA